MIKRATILRMPWAVDFANGANIPLAVNADMTKVVTFEASLIVAWMVTVKWTVYRCPLNSPFRQDFMIQFCVLDSQFNGGSERGGGGRGYNLRVVTAVSSAEYRSTSATNSGIWNWWKREKRSSWMVR